MWKKIRAWCKDSESIAAARLVALLGAVASTLAALDPGVLQAAVAALGLAKWWPLLVLAGGVVLELLRNARDPAMKRKR